jgi:hypothetical protein
MKLNKQRLLEHIIEEGIQDALRTRKEGMNDETLIDHISSYIWLWVLITTLILRRPLDVYAVLQEDEVIDYFRDKDSAEAEAFNQFERGNTFRLYVVQIITDYDGK